MALQQFNQFEPKLAGLEGNMQAEPRVFAHDAVLVVIGAINDSDSNHGLNMTSGGSGYDVDNEITITTPTGTGFAVGDRAIVVVTAVDAAGAVTDYYIKVSGVTNKNYLVGGAANHVSVTPGTGSGFAATVSNIDIPHTQKRGCCLYIGDITAGAQMKVVMESAKHNGTAGTGYTATDTVTFEGVLAGGYNPILVKQLVYNATGPTSVVALY